MRKLMIMAVLSILVWATTSVVPSGNYQFNPLQIAGDVGPGGG